MATHFPSVQSRIVTDCSRIEAFSQSHSVPNLVGRRLLPTNADMTATCVMGLAKLW